MAAMDYLIKNAVDLILANLPPETQSQLAELAKTGIGLKDQLDRIESGQQELRILLTALVQALQPETQHHVRAAIEQREPPENSFG